MDLPFFIRTEPGQEPVLSVDGAWGAPGLNLSHWPGNTTPADLRHDLSTGCALAFARLPAAERAARAAGCVALVNNHFDTDGVCAAFAVRRPELALAHERALLDAAAAGDFFRLPSEAAFQLDALVQAFADPERSPLAERLAPLDARARHELATRELLERLPELLAGGLAEHADLWGAPLDALRADRADLEAAQCDELVHLALTVWTAACGSGSRRAGEDARLPFDPGRHAMFGTSDADRVLALGPHADGGTTCRYVGGTAAFFELVTSRAQPRPDLAALCAELNAAEGSSQADECAWRHQDPRGASPELWFGRSGLARYVEHAAPYLAPSRLGHEEVKSRVIDAVRATWVFPVDGDETSDAGDPFDLG